MQQYLNVCGVMSTLSKLYVIYHIVFILIKLFLTSSLFNIRNTIYVYMCTLYRAVCS